MHDNDTPAPIQANDFGRRFIIDVERDGVATVRDRDRDEPSKGLPIFTTDTRDEAESLIIRHCKLSRYGTGEYRLNDWPLDATLDDLYAAGAKFRESYAAMRARGARS